MVKADWKRRMWLAAESLACLCIIIASLPAAMQNALIIPPGSEGGTYKIADFLAYYNAAQIIAQQGWQVLYDPAVQAAAQARLTPETGGDFLAFFYPPHTAWIFYPLHAVPLMKAYGVWCLVNALGTFALLHVLRLCGLLRHPGSMAAACALLVTSVPWLLTMAQGQVSMLMTLALAGVWAFVCRGHAGAAGCLLVLSAFKPALSFVPALYGLVCHGKAFRSGVLITSLMALLACMALYGSGIVYDYALLMQNAAHAVKQMGAEAASMPNLRGILLRLTGENFNNAASALWILSVACGAYAAFKARRAGPRTQETGFAFAVMLSLPFSPWLHAHTLLLAVLPVAIALRDASRIIVLRYLVCHTLVMAAVALFPGFASFIWFVAQLLLAAWLYAQYCSGLKAET